MLKRRRKNKDIYTMTSKISRVGLVLEREKTRVWSDELKMQIIVFEMNRGSTFFQFDLYIQSARGDRPVCVCVCILVIDRDEN